MALRGLPALLLALALTGAAQAGVAEIRAVDGTLVGEATHGRFVSRDDGWTLTVQSASSSAAGTDLAGVSLLGGKIWVARIFVPAHGTEGAALYGLTVDNQAVDAKPNTIVPLGPSTYLVALQTAVLPGTRKTGLVALRLVVGDDSFGTPAGTQVLVGLARGDAPRVKKRHATLPWLLLGVSGAAAAVPETALLPTAPFLQAHGTLGDRAAELAQRFLGVPYVWAGASPTAGFDCSGLTMFVYGQLGIRLGHYTGTQWNQGERIPASELAPGDLVFFDGLGHEGIYIGGGRFVHAPHTGDVVKISSLADPRYGLAFVGAVRPYAN